MTEKKCKTCGTRLGKKNTTDYCPVTSICGYKSLVCILCTNDNAHKCQNATVHSFCICSCHGQNTRTNFEMEKLLHKYNVIARKRQIQLQILDNEIPYQPYNLSSYVTPERRKYTFKIMWNLLLLRLKELKP